MLPQKESPNPSVASAHQPGRNHYIASPERPATQRLATTLRDTSARSPIEPRDGRLPNPLTRSTADYVPASAIHSLGLRTSPIELRRNAVATALAAFGTTSFPALKAALGMDPNQEARRFRGGYRGRVASADRLARIAGGLIDAVNVAFKHDAVMVFTESAAVLNALVPKIAKVADRRADSGRSRLADALPASVTADSEGSTRLEARLKSALGQTRPHPGIDAKRMILVVCDQPNDGEIRALAARLGTAFPEARIAGMSIRVQEHVAGDLPEVVAPEKTVGRPDIDLRLSKELDAFAQIIGEHIDVVAPLPQVARLAFQER